MNRSKLLFILIVLTLLAGGCAQFTSDDTLLTLQSRMTKLELDFDRYKKATDARLSDTANLRKEMSLLSEDFRSLRGDLERFKQEIRAGQAELGTGLGSVREYVSRLEGRLDLASRGVDEVTRSLGNLRKEMGELGERTAQLMSLLQAQEKKLTSLEGTITGAQREMAELNLRLEGLREENLKRIKGLEEGLARLESQQRALAPPPPPLPPKVEPPQPPPEPGVARTLSPMEQAYEEASNLFRSGDYKGAKEKFREFLIKFPDAPLAPDALFLVAESSFNLKSYDEAIVEYEEFMKKYPKGDRIPSAMLKQGLAFLELGEKVYASLIFSQVVKKFPDTKEAELAQAKLKELR